MCSIYMLIPYHDNNAAMKDSEAKFTFKLNLQSGWLKKQTLNPQNYRCDSLPRESSLAGL